MALVGLVAIRHKVIGLLVITAVDLRLVNEAHHLSFGCLLASPRRRRRARRIELRCRGLMAVMGPHSSAIMQPHEAATPTGALVGGGATT
jgi:hypothetical protein